MGALIHKTHLPCGVSATFSFVDGEMSVAWEPDIPTFRSQRRQRQFLRAYQRARAEFLSIVATTLSVGVMAVDVGNGQIIDTEVIAPEVTH